MYLDVGLFRKTYWWIKCFAAFFCGCVWIEDLKRILCAVFLCVGSWSSDQARRHTRPDLGASLLWVHSTECHCSFRNKGRMWPVPHSCRAQTSTRAGLIWCQLCVSSVSLADSWLESKRRVCVIAEWQCVAHWYGRGFVLKALRWFVWDGLFVSLFLIE